MPHERAAVGGLLSAWHRRHRQAASVVAVAVATVLVGMAAGLALGLAGAGPGASSVQSETLGIAFLEEPGVGQVAAASLTVREEASDEAPALAYTVAEAGTVSTLPVTVDRDDPVYILGERRDDWTRIAVNIRYHFFESFRVGWVPTGTAKAPTLAPFDPAHCPEHGDGHFDVPPFPHDVSVLTCFGDRQLVLDGQFLEPVTGRCPAMAFLMCGWSEVPSLSGVPLFIDPTRAIIQPEPGGSVTVVGHFDDPQSVRCGDDAPDEATRIIAVLRCRTSFVVTELQTPPGPHSPVAALEPSLEYTGAEPYADGVWIRYSFRVANREDFADELFAPASSLPACGGHSPAARTWTVLKDEGGHELARFCVPGRADVLGQLSFNRQAADPPPATVFVELLDRRDGVIYRSMPVAVTP